MSIRNLKNTMELLIDLKKGVSNPTNEQTLIFNELFLRQLDKKRVSRNRRTLLKKYDNKYYYSTANSKARAVVVAKNHSHLLICNNPASDFGISKGSQAGYYDFKNAKLVGLDAIYIKSKWVEKLLTKSENSLDTVSSSFSFRLVYHYGIGKLLLHNDLYNTAYDLDILLNAGFDIDLTDYHVNFARIGSGIVLTVEINSVVLVVSPFKISSDYDTVSKTCDLKLTLEYLNPNLQVNS